jgi:hypothetical protein
MRGLVQFIADLRNARARELEEKRINKELANIRYGPHVEWGTRTNMYLLTGKSSEVGASSNRIAPMSWGTQKC